MTQLVNLAQRVERREAEMGIIGLGYAGLPQALAFAQAGFPVTGIDQDAFRVEQLNSGSSHIGELPGLRIEVH